MDKGIVVEIYKDSDHTALVDVINARIDPTVLTEIGENGGGSFKVSKRDPKVSKRPSLLAYRNLVRVRVNGKVVGGFVIQNKKTVIVGAGEASEEMWEVSGEGFISGSNDAAVFPAGGLKSNSREARYFNFTSPRGSWYKDTDWKDAVRVRKWNSNNEFWYTAPAQWPDAPQAWWLWDRANPFQMPKGYAYFRHEFTTNDPAAQAYAFFFALDDRGEVFIDGELVHTTAEHSWPETSRVDFNLDPGPHIIAIKAYNYKGDGPGGVIGALFKVGDANTPTSAELISTTGNSSWKVCAYPVEEPGWTPGEIVRTLLSEAKARVVRWADNVVPTFTNTHDSAGNAWPRVSANFRVGTLYSDVLKSISELYCDFYLDPDTFELSAWVVMGTDRSLQGTAPRPVLLQKGHNLTVADETGQASISNTVLLHTAEGWVLKTDSGSVGTYGRVENQMATDLSTDAATPLVTELFRQKALPESSSTLSLVPVPGMIPFVDFHLGDHVSAPGDSGELEKRRVMSISVTEDDTGNPVYSIEFDTIFKDRQTELERWVSRLTNASSIGGGFSNATGLPSTVHQGGPPTMSFTNVPDAPTGLYALSTGRWAKNGSAVSDIQLFWNPVISAKGAVITDVEKYEVLGRLASDPYPRILTTVFDASAKLNGFEAGSEWKFSVRALGRVSGTGILSNEIDVTLAIPLVPLGKPSKPVLTSGMGSVTIKWDGLLNGNPAPGHFRYLVVQRKLASAPTSAFADLTVLSGVSTVDASGDTNVEYSYRLIPVDTLGLRGTASDPANIVVRSVIGTDIDDAVIEDIAADVADLIVTVDGKITIATRAPTAADGQDKTTGSIWWRREADGKIVELFEWTGSAWEVRPMGEGAIADGAITDAKIGSVSAGKISTGTLDAARIASLSITVDKLLVTDFSNIAQGSDFEGEHPWNLPAGGAFSISSTLSRAKTGTKSLAIDGTKTGTARLKGKISASPGEEWYIEFWVSKSTTWNGTNSNSKLRVGDQDGALVSGVSFGTESIPAANAAPIKLSGVIKFPAGTTEATVTMLNNATAGYVWIDDIVIRRRSSGELIVDGAITTRTLAAEAVQADNIAAGTITVDRLEPNAGKNLDIQGNGTINLIVETQETIHTTLGTANDDIKSAADAAEAAGKLANTANSGIGTVSGRVTDVDEKADTISESLVTTQTYFRVTSEGAVIGKTSSPTTFHMKNTGAEIRENGVRVTWWDSGQMVVPSLRADKVVLGNHQLEKSGSTRTVMRYLG